MHRLHKACLLSLGLLVLVQAQFQQGERIGDINGIQEASGLASSRDNEGLLWIASSIEGRPLITAIDGFGNPVAAFDLQTPDGLLNEGFADMAAGPGPGEGEYLYLVDAGPAGDLGSYQSLRIYRVPEPLLFPEPEHFAAAMPLEGVDIITLSFPRLSADDQEVRAQTLMVDPLSGEIVISIQLMDLQQEAVFATPPSTTVTPGSFELQVQPKGYLTLGWGQTFFKGIAGDVSPDGTEIIVQSNQGVHYSPRTGRILLSDAVIDGAGFVQLPHDQDPGQAIAFASDNSGYYSLRAEDDNLMSLYFYGRIGRGVSVDINRPPSAAPSRDPTLHPSNIPTSQPTTKEPSGAPTLQTTLQPAKKEPTPQPTLNPTSQPTLQPTTAPTFQPAPFPTFQPIAPFPTFQPSPWNGNGNANGNNNGNANGNGNVNDIFNNWQFWPSNPEPLPPSATMPSQSPSASPTSSPSNAPSISSAPSISAAPSLSPSVSHAPSTSKAPSTTPTYAPTGGDDDNNDYYVEEDQDVYEDPLILNVIQTPQPTNPPTPQPTNPPTPQPTNPPTLQPTNPPTGEPSESPTTSRSPTEEPSASPTKPPTMFPTNEPSERPTLPPVAPKDEPYIPGLLTHEEFGLLLSSGLNARIIAKAGEKVIFKDGFESDDDFHDDPDFGATFWDTRGDNPGGWVYVSNSETSSGGVGAITFDSHGNPIWYEMLLEGTTDNCGGGRTPWDTWISCEETSGGKIWQVDPMGQVGAQAIDIPDGGEWESFAWDDRHIADAPRFYVTEDTSDGALLKMTPIGDIDWSDKYTQWDMLHGPMKIEWLLLHPNNGTFSWTTDREVAKGNASDNYPNSEGIDSHNGILYFVCKGMKRMFELDLDTGEYTSGSTDDGLFDGEPDQVYRILQEGFNDFLFFTEEGGDDAGIHGRDASGVFFTLLESPDLSDETTGLAFSPDMRHIYVAYQSEGLLFDITRQDEFPFHAFSIDLKYHNTNKQ